MKGYRIVGFLPVTPIVRSRSHVVVNGNEMSGCAGVPRAHCVRRRACRRCSHYVHMSAVNTMEIMHDVQSVATHVNNYCIAVGMEEIERCKAGRIGTVCKIHMLRPKL